MKKKTRQVKARMTQEGLARLLAIEKAVKKYLRIHDSKGGEDYDGSLRPVRLALSLVRPTK